MTNKDNPMNTMPHQQPTHTPTSSSTPIAKVPFQRIVATEMRKIVSTRASRLALALATIASIVTAAILTSRITAGSVEMSWLAMFRFSTIWLDIVVAVLGIQTIAGEWSQRTHLITFTLTPDRRRVWFAKLLTVMCYIAAATVVAMVICAAMYSLAGPLTGTSLTWDVGADDLVRAAVLNVVSGLVGFGFGSVLLSPAVALTAYFAMPMVLGLVQSAFPVLREHARWWDLSTSMSQLHTAQLSGTLVAQLATVSVIWLAIPLFIGYFRVLRSKIA